MADRYLLESGAPDGYLLEDGTGVLSLEVPGIPAVFRSKSFIATSSATSLTATEPSGAAQDDILLVWLNTDGSSIILPANWALVAGTNYDGTAAKTRLAWIRRGASAPGYLFSWSGGSYAEIGILCYSGCETTGDPWNVVALATNNAAVNAPIAAPAITTTVADTVAVIFGMWWQGLASGTWGAPSGYTIREPNSTSWGDTGAAEKALATPTTETPGAWTGSFQTGTNNSSGVTIALKPPEAGATATAPPPYNNRYIQLLSF